ncbi:MAG: hypothetical protein GY835_23905 [bacterium]|nr:hypothetical protein [bacterium]
MAILTTQQYRPVTTWETAAYDPLSCRFVQDNAANMNNFACYVARHKAFDAHFRPVVDSPDSGTTAETVILPSLGKFFMASQFVRLRWWITFKRTTGAANITYKLYISDRLYRGPAVLDTSYLGNYESDTLVCDSDTKETKSATIEVPFRDPLGYVWPLLTVANDNGNDADLYYVAAQPES